MSLSEFEPIKNEVLDKLDRLDPSLTYHCTDHTLDVLEQSIRIAEAEGIRDEQALYLLKIAALYHDTGFLQTYKHHEEVSCRIFLEDSERFSFSEEDRIFICRLIMVTQIPQRPTDIFESIICDADLDYLGRDDFFAIGDTLRLEFLHYKVVNSNEEWEVLQNKFLQNHHYHTKSSQALREPSKQLNIARLMVQ
jgi:predicted metal-dependent HD superfamily phosphohydrolase